jgi:hypothetical protein
VKYRLDFGCKLVDLQALSRFVGQTFVWVQLHQFLTKSVYFSMHLCLLISSARLESFSFESSISHLLECNEKCTNRLVFSELIPIGKKVLVRPPHQKLVFSELNTDYYCKDSNYCRVSTGYEPDCSIAIVYPSSYSYCLFLIESFINLRVLCQHGRYTW